MNNQTQLMRFVEDVDAMVLTFEQSVAPGSPS